MLLTAVHIDDNEVTNDSVVISHVSSSKNYKLVKLRQECYQSQSLQYDFYWTKMRPELNNR